MRQLTIRKAYKASCELKEKLSTASTKLGVQSKYDVHGGLGVLGDLILSLHEFQEKEVRFEILALDLVCTIRQRIQVANNKPLPYAEEQTINDLIAKQASLKTKLAYYPEDTKIAVTPTRDLEMNADRVRSTLADTTNSYRSSTSQFLMIAGTSQEFKDQLGAERLALRVELESVTGTLAYANIQETVELTDEEAEILRTFRIPV